MIGRIPILDVQPVVDCGRRPVRAVTGETFQVSATVFREGHEMLGAGAVLRAPDGSRQDLAVMRELAEGTDRYGGDVTVTSTGMWQFHVEAWGDPIARWQHDAAIKIPLGQDLELMLADGAALFERAASRIKAPRAARPGRAGQRPGQVVPGSGRAARAALEALAARLRDDRIPPLDRLAAATSEELAAILAAFPLREMLTSSGRFPVIVHRKRALYGSWYEYFPRSEGARVDGSADRTVTSGTLRTAARRLDAVARMGFDVVYLPPVHPIGYTARKGANNSLNAAPGDPGSPWAIGSAEGGHDAIHPDLGTIDDFDSFVRRAGELGMEVALDLALQCSPDHPWVAKHPEWFTTRSDGSIAYAENPPKKYQDIVPLNFDNDPEGIYTEVLRIIRYWMSHGVRIFRVDNPHTKPLPFWERLLAEVAGTDPDVIFLAEAFTRPAMMAGLAIIGFHQSYTYFTWRNSADELAEYLRELSGPAAAYMRPNFFVNTPDILSEYLQYGGPAAFRVRAVLAAMLAPSWGVYSGYELCENVAIVPGSEEYMDSEKYQYRPRDWEHAETVAADISPFITHLNMIRKNHPALHWLRNVRFHYSDQPEILCFSKSVSGFSQSVSATGDGAPERDTVLVVVNLDPYRPHEATIWLDAAALGVRAGAELVVTDELSGESYRWGQANYVRLDPAGTPAHIFTVAARQPGG
ncbi:MAG: alpha-1,4-glucan--maltose-1-phosphate maltosyltransferase [Streptosporangiaceae bacterium]